MKIFLIRHGETDYNKKHILMGQLDIPINSQGRKEAEATAEYLLDKGITKIFCSSLLRASETAKIISSKLDLPFIEQDELMEHTLGEYDGITVRDFLEEMKTVKELEELILPKGGERVADFKDRVWKKFEEDISTNLDKGNILIVTHGGVTRAIFSKIFDSTDIIFDTLSQENCCINIIGCKREGKEYNYHVELVNYTYHIDRFFK